jgi:hypothetical protein
VSLISSRRRWHHAFFLSLACLLSSLAAATGQGWKPAPAPLMTRWAREVSPERSRPEYPRPQMSRRAWQSLNGLWEFAFDDGNQGRGGGWSSGKQFPRRILVPFTFEAALSGIGYGAEVHERVWYRRTFTVPRDWRSRLARSGRSPGERLLLHFGAVDWEATVWVNGRELGMHRGGYSPFSFDIKEALRRSGPQEVVLSVYDPADPRKGAFQPKGKQLGSEGIWYTRTSGIWQTVWLEPVPARRIERLRAEGDPQGGLLTVTAQIAGDTPRGRLRVNVRMPGGAPVRSEGVVGAAGTVRVTARVPNARPWTPESPTLYDLTVELQDGSRVVDQVESYVGFRKVGMRDGRLTLNGRPYFYRGVLDQGYWPDGILTPPSDAAIRAEVEMTKALGFNLSRKHVKVEDPRWYYWCDRLGLAVWQDMPSSHNLQAPGAEANFRQELTAMVEQLRGHPCIVHWVPFNENWGDPKQFQDEMVRLVRGLDPSRPITDASGWTQRGLTDVIDIHDYSNNLLRHGVERPTRPKVIGEFGGIALPIPGHTWNQGWGYQTVRTPDDLLRRLKRQVSQLFEAPGLSGFVYTQLTDVEQEQNGLLTYDRLTKAPTEKVAAIFTGRDRLARDELVQPGYLTDWWVLGPIPLGERLTSAQNTAENERVMGAALSRAFVAGEASLRPGEGETLRVGDRTLRWRRVQAAPDALDLNQVFGQTDNAVAYAVAVIDVPQAVDGLQLLFGSDDAAKVWLNGREIWSVNRTRGVNLDEDLVPGLSLRAGRNTLVVKVVQGVGGWGLAARFVRKHGAPFRDFRAVR